MIIFELVDVIAFIFLLYTLIVFGLKKNVTAFISLLTVLYCYYDWIYLQLKHYTDYEIFFLSGYSKEIAIYLLITFFVIYTAINKKNIATIMPPILVLILASIIGILKQDFSAFVVGFNSYIPMLLMLFVLRVNDRQIDITKYLFFVMITVVVPNVVYSLYQFAYYNRLEDFWFYNAFIHSGFELNEWDYFRDNSVRVFGFFSNTLALTFFCFFTLLGILTYIKRGKIILASFVLIPMFLSGTRTVFIGLLVYAMLMLIYKVKMPTKLKGYLYIFTWTSTFIGTMLVILTLSTEASSLGRVVQWQNAINELILNPLGHGIGYAGVGLSIWPDSNVIAFIYMIGCIAIAGIIYTVYKFSRKLSLSQNLSFLFLLLALFVAMYQNVSAIIMLPIIALVIDKRTNISNAKFNNNIS